MPFWFVSFSSHLCNTVHCSLGTIHLRSQWIVVNFISSRHCVWILDHLYFIELWIYQSADLIQCLHGFSSLIFNSWMICVKMSIVFSNGKSSLGGIQQLRGQNFTIFWPPPLRGQFLYPERGQKQTFLTPRVHVHVVIECPLMGHLLMSNLKFKSWIDSIMRVMSCKTTFGQIVTLNEKFRLCMWHRSRHCTVGNFREILNNSARWEIVHDSF